MTSAKIFDPLGLLSPFTIQWKVLFQELCTERSDWDEQLKGDRLKKWKTLVLELQTLNSVCIPRSFFDYTSGNWKAAELHCFSDASEKAYSASIYIRSIYEHGRIDVKLVASKTKVVPLKKQIIARLELLGGTILVRLAKTAQNPLPQKLETVFWVDSVTVLCWIRNFKSWKQYFMSRVQEIRAHTTPDSWRFCLGNQNPDDIPSRGMSASELVSEKRWWKDPEFLCKEERECPQEEKSQSDDENAWKEIVQNPATTTRALINSTQVTKIGIHQITAVSRYSSWKKLRVTPYVVRFTGTSRKDKGLELCAEEVRSAEELWIKSIQYQSFPDEICHLVEARKLPESLLVRQLTVASCGAEEEFKTAY